MHRSPEAPRSLRIVIPAYNEESRIGPTLTQYCSEFGDLATVVVVAGGCTDGTVGVVHDLQATFHNLELLEIAKAIGKGGAVRAGFTVKLNRTIAFRASGAEPPNPPCSSRIGGPPC